MACMVGYFDICRRNWSLIIISTEKVFMSCKMTSLLDFWSIFAVDYHNCVSLLSMVSYFSVYFRHCLWGFEFHFSLAHMTGITRSHHFATSSPVTCQPTENYNNKQRKSLSCLTIININYNYTSIFICKITISDKELFLLILTQGSPVRRQFKQYFVDIFVVSYEKI